MLVQEIRRLYATGNCFETVRIAFDVDAGAVLAALRLPSAAHDGLQDKIDLYLASDGTAHRYVLSGSVPHSPSDAMDPDFI
jgi:hypothetical protein